MGPHWNIKGESYARIAALTALTAFYLFSVMRPDRYLCMTLERRVW